MSAATVQPLHADAPATGRGIDAIPVRDTKTIHLIRHGMGYHNEVKVQEDYRKEDFFDAHLNELGWAQAHALNEHIKCCDLRVDLVVVSPLTRTLETSAGVFGQNLLTQGRRKKSEQLMVAQDAKPGEQVVHAAIVPRGTPPCVANELCRETLGVHPCDRRRTIAEQAAAFPGVDFGEIEHDEDVYWSSNIRESSQDIEARARKFAEWLMARPERNIAVVSHSGFIYSFMQNYGHSCSPQIAQHLHRHFKNCEMRSIVLMDQKPKQVPNDPVWFPGGDVINEVTSQTSNSC